MYHCRGILLFAHEYSELSTSKRHPVAPEVFMIHHIGLEVWTLFQLTQELAMPKLPFSLYVLPHRKSTVFIAPVPLPFRCPACKGTVFVTFQYGGSTRVIECIKCACHLKLFTGFENILNLNLF